MKQKDSWAGVSHLVMALLLTESLGTEARECTRDLADHS